MHAKGPGQEGHVALLFVLKGLGDKCTTHTLRKKVTNWRKMLAIACRCQLEIYL
jgi:hypothetical protein